MLSPTHATPLFSEVAHDSALEELGVNRVGFAYLPVDLFKTQQRRKYPHLSLGTLSEMENQRVEDGDVLLHRRCQYRITVKPYRRSCALSWSHDRVRTSFLSHPFDVKNQTSVKTRCSA